MRIRYLVARRWADGALRPQFETRPGDEKVVGTGDGEVTYPCARRAVDRDLAEFVLDETDSPAPEAKPEKRKSWRRSAPAPAAAVEDDPTS